MVELKLKKLIPHKATETTRSTVSAMAAFGITYDTIAHSLGICEDTLRRHYKSELKHGKQLAIAKVANSLFKKAVGGDTASMCFYLKTQGGWREKHDIELNGGVTINLPKVAADI